MTSVKEVMGNLVAMHLSALMALINKYPWLSIHAEGLCDSTGGPLKIAMQ